MLNFPEWSDMGKASETSRNTWAEMSSSFAHYYRYFSGEIFNERVPVEEPVDGQPPLLYPVGLNLVKMICLAQADAEFGEWADNIVNFEIKGEDEADASGKAAIKLANQILASSNGNTLLWEAALDRNIYGGSAIKVFPALEKPNYIRWQKIPIQCFYPIPDPDDPSKLLETYIRIDMSAEQAKIKYGIDKPGQIVTRIEHWTTSSYENVIDGKRIDQYSGMNPWGFVPFVYIPRFRSERWWGEALSGEIIPAQDEMNMRIADTGEAINYNAHPVRWGFNLPRSFNATNYPLDPNSLWDLGRTIGNSPPPMVGILEAKSAVQQGVFDYINFLYDWTRTSSFAPPIAFGDDNGGGQRSGATLEIRMWPLIKQVRRSRSYMRDGIKMLLSMSGKILRQKKFSEVPSRAIDALIDQTLDVSFAELMPRDHLAIVDEVVKLMSTNPPSISIESAQKILGRNPAEVERIEGMLKRFKEYMQKTPANNLTEGVKGKTTPQVESK
jgi:hypothetical protein